MHSVISREVGGYADENLTVAATMGRASWRRHTGMVRVVEVMTELSTLIQNFVMSLLQPTLLEVFAYTDETCRAVA